MEVITVNYVQWKTRKVSALIRGGKGGRRCKPRSLEVQMCLKEEVVIPAHENERNCPLFHLPVLSGFPQIECCPTMRVRVISTFFV